MRDDLTSSSTVSIYTAAISGRYGARDQFAERVFPRIRRFSGWCLRRVARGLLVESTEIANQVIAEMLWPGRETTAPLAVPREAMFRRVRQTVIAWVRRERALKRGGRMTRQPLEQFEIAESNMDIWGTDERRKLIEALSRLALEYPIEHQAVVSKTIDGLNWSDVSLAMGMTISTARRRHHSGIQILKSWVRG